MRTRLWHGFADMHVVADHEIVMVSGDGSVLTDADGREYIDATAALWYCNVGYGRREIADAVAAQLTKLNAYSSFGPYTTEASVAVADRLATMAPFPDAVVFLGSGGSDAIDTATKLARRYWDVIGQPGKRVIVSREHAYHGMHVMGTALVGMAAMRDGYGSAPFVGDVAQVPAMDVEAVARLFEQRGHEIAAFIGEPVIGAGGVIPPSDGYWAAINRLCREHDVLLIADEVITGFGRMGETFGSTRFGIEPDLITFAKGVTSGYVPLGGVLVGRRVREPFWDRPVPAARTGSPAGPSPVFRHGYTYQGHSGAAAAALANLDIIEREDLIGRVRRLEPILAAAVRRLESAPLVGETRAIGLTAAVALKPEVLATDPGAVEKVVAAALRHGVATRVLRGHAVHISPPFVITEAQIDSMVDGIGSALEDVAATAVRA